MLTWLETDDALVCCVENTVEDRIMDSGALLHATYCKEELERFKLRPGKDVRYIPGLKRRLILVGQLDEEGYHVGFGDQQWKVTKGSLVVARGNKRKSLYMVEIGMSMLASKSNVPDVRKVDIYFYRPGGLGKQKNLSFIMSCGRYNANLQVKCLKFDNGGEYSSWPIKFCVENGIVMLKMVPETPLQFGVAERLSRTFRSMGIRAEAPKMLWADQLARPT
nr:hypothetical protein [Tanacetum cinerariifolium]